MWNSDTGLLLFPSSLHRLKALHNNDTHIHVTLGTVGKAIWFTRTELAAWSTRDTLIPTDVGKLCHHFIQHSLFLFLLHWCRKKRKWLEGALVWVKISNRTQICTAIFKCQFFVVPSCTHVAYKTNVSDQHTIFFCQCPWATEWL